MVLENRKDIIPEVGHFFIGRGNEFFRDWNRKDGKLYILDKKHKPLIKIAGLEELCKITLFNCYKANAQHQIETPEDYWTYHTLSDYGSGRMGACLVGVDFEDIPKPKDFLKLVPEGYREGLAGFELEEPGSEDDAFGHPNSRYYNIILYVKKLIEEKRRQKLLDFFEEDSY